MKKMSAKNNVTSLGLIIVIIFTSMMAFLVYKTNTVVDNKKSKIGQTIIVSRDTLIIVDWNPSSSTYTLSNGVKVSDEFIGKINQ